MIDINNNKIANTGINLNEYYGPYTNLHEAHTILSENGGLNQVGFTIGIEDLTTHTIEEYWYQGGTTEAHLVKKGTDTTQLEQTVDGINENYLKAGQSSGSSSVDFDAFADTIHNNAQTLSSTQKQQARQNIDAVSGADLKTLNGQSLVGSGNIDIERYFKGWFVSSSALPANPVVGDYAYVKGGTSSDPATIYECITAGQWSNSGRTADTSNVQTFASSQEVNEVHIVNDLTTGGEDDVLSAEQGKNLNTNIILGEKSGIKITPKDVIQTESNNEYIQIVRDNDGYVLSGIRIDGTSHEYTEAYFHKNINIKTINNGYPVYKEEGKGLINTDFANGVISENSSEYLYTIVDKNGYVVFAIKLDGDILLGSDNFTTTKIKRSLTTAENYIKSNTPYHYGKYLYSLCQFGSFYNKEVKFNMPSVIEVQNDNYIKCTSDINGQVIEVLTNNGIRI